MKVFGNGSIEKRGKESFRLTVVIGYLDGKPQKKHKTIKAKGEREARRCLNQWIEALEASGITNDPGSMTVADILDQELQDCALRGLSAATLGSYHSIVEGRLKPKLGSIKISDLTTGMLTNFYREMKSSGGPDGRPLSANTVKRNSTVLNKALERAVADGYLDRNPNEHAERFVGRTKDSAKRKDKEVELDPDAMNAIVNRAQLCNNKALGTAIMLAACSGMRRAEVCGLLWENVDLDNRMIHIEDDLAEVKKEYSPTGETLVLGDTKTDESERDLPIIPCLHKYLKEESKRQKDLAEYLGLHFGKDTPVVCNKYLKYFRPNTITTDFDTFVIDNNLNPEATFKSLRSGVASLLASEKIPIAAVSMILGHTDIQTTMRYYIKYCSGDVKFAMKYLQKRLVA